MIGLTLAQVNARHFITLFGQDYPCDALDNDELELFNAQFNELVGTTDSILRRILEPRALTIANGLRAIKNEMNSPMFRGINPSDGELGWSFIRPEFVKANNVIINDWNVTLTGMATWDRWLDATATTGFVLSEEHGLIITHLTSEVTPSPFARGVHFKVGRADLIPYDISDIILGDNENNVSHYPIPTMVVKPEAELLSTITGVVGTEYLKLGGFVVGLGRRLKAETPAW